MKRVCSSPYRRRAAGIITLLILVGCDRGNNGTDRRPCVGVTTSYLACALDDVAPERFRIVRLLPPGGCPGHFDVTPRTIDDLRGAALLFRFDFQGSLDGKLERLKASGLKVIPVPAAEGMSIPDTYATACDGVCGALCEQWPAEATRFRLRLVSLLERLARLSKDARRQVSEAGLCGAGVLSSGHQAAFCRWLGLDVVGTFPKGDDARMSELAESLAVGRSHRVKLVIANLQEGVRVAQRLSGNLGARMVVFSNFPSMGVDQRTFDDLLRANVRALVEGTTSAPATAASTPSTKESNQ